MGGKPRHKLARKARTNRAVRVARAKHISEEEMRDTIYALSVRSRTLPVRLDFGPSLTSGTMLLVRSTVPERDCGLPVDISLTRFFEHTDFATRDDLLRAVFEAYAEIWMHEAAESFYFGEQRPFDPHNSMRLSANPVPVR